MSGTLPELSRCCQPDGSVLVSSIPGPPGADGSAAAAGANGKNAYTTTGAAFTMPNEGVTSPSLLVVNSDFLALNEYVVLQGEGILQVISIPDSTHVTLKNVANTASGLYTGNSAPGTVVALGSRLVPAGQQGPTGAAGAGQTMNGLSPTTTKGDLLVDNGLNNPNASVVRHGAGANGLRPVYDSTTADGFRNDKVDLSSAAEVKNVLAAVNGGNADRLALAGGVLTGDLQINKATPNLFLINPGAALDQKAWALQASGSILQLLTYNDLLNAFSLIFTVSRTGFTPTQFFVVPTASFFGPILVNNFLQTLQAIDLGLVNGSNNNHVFPTTSFVKILPGPTGAFTITGIAGGADGRRLTLYNATGQNMTISHQDVLSTASNRIISTTGASVVTTGDGTVDLIYSIDDQRWIVIASTA